MYKSVIIGVVLVTLLVPWSVQSADVHGPLPQGPMVGGHEPSPCFAVFHELHDGKGYSLVRHGPEQVIVVRHLRYANGFSLNGRVLSVTTGPGARVELYNRRHFRKLMFEIGPESAVNLSRPVMDSYRLHCIPTFVPMMPTPPPAFK